LDVRCQSAVITGIKKLMYNVIIIYGAIVLYTFVIKFSEAKCNVIDEEKHCLGIKSTANPKP